MPRRPGHTTEETEGRNQLANRVGGGGGVPDCVVGCRVLGVTQFPRGFLLVVLLPLTALLLPFLPVLFYASRRFQEHDVEVASLAFSPDDRLLMSASCQR